MNDLQAGAVHSVPDRSALIAESHQLPAGHDPMLALEKARKRPLAVARTPLAPPKRPLAVARTPLAPPRARLVIYGMPKVALGGNDVAFGGNGRMVAAAHARIQARVCRERGAAQYFRAQA